MTEVLGLAGSISEAQEDGREREHEKQHKDGCCLFDKPSSNALVAPRWWHAGEKCTTQIYGVLRSSTISVEIVQPEHHWLIGAPGALVRL
eukprot:SAG31_NODE_389_length_16370_cov_4.517915_7_plen_90_part_00